MSPPLTPPVPFRPYTKFQIDNNKKGGTLKVRGRLNKTPFKILKKIKKGAYYEFT